MTPITSNISSLSATPYVDAFTTGEIVGFVVLIICTQIVITLVATWFITVYVRGKYRGMLALQDYRFRCIETTVDDISDRLPERM